jgi:hypothetical protein
MRPPATAAASREAGRTQVTDAAEPCKRAVRAPRTVGKAPDGYCRRRVAPLRVARTAARHGVGRRHQEYVDVQHRKVCDHAERGDDSLAPETHRCLRQCGNRACVEQWQDPTLRHRGVGAPQQREQPAGWNQRHSERGRRADGQSLRGDEAFGDLLSRTPGTTKDNALLRSGPESCVTFAVGLKEMEA